MKKPFELKSSIRPKDTGTAAFRIVLHESARAGELVVHHENTDPPGEFYWGHYHADALTDPEAGAEAMADYVSTCIKYGLNPCG